MLMLPVAAIHAMVALPRLCDDRVAVRHGIERVLHHKRHVARQIDINLTAIVTVAVYLEFMGLSRRLGVAHRKLARRKGRQILFFGHGRHQTSHLFPFLLIILYFRTKSQ